MFRHLAYFLLFTAFPMLAQELPFSIALRPVEIPGMGGLQSFAFGQQDGKWLIAGGRLDGLHRRQPFASFDLAGHNNQLWVIDPIEKKSWSASLTDLPAEIQEQLSSTNMEFIQEGNVLYCLGGYGYSSLVQDHTTFAKITAIQVAETIKAIVEGKSFVPYIRQYAQAAFQVCGGHLHKINDTYYLLGGQKFIGRYNPMGPDHGPGFIQEYTNEIRRFKIMDDGTNLSIPFLPSYTDAENLHRRDYNAKEQIMPDGSEGITMFSGVFRPDADLPYLNAVNVDSTGYSVNDSFQQLFNHYHCATLPVYDATNNEMHTVFFGGIAQYYMADGKLVKDDNVPFVQTIGGVTRRENGRMHEFVFPVSMPSFLGAGSEFIPDENIPVYNNGVVKLHALTSDSTRLGHIFGGISSSAPNIFFINDGSQSEASSVLFEVWLVKNKLISTQEPDQSDLSIVKVFPNPGVGSYVIEFFTERSGEVILQLHTADGKVLPLSEKYSAQAGKNTWEYKLPSSLPEGSYLIVISQHGRAGNARWVLKQ